MDLTQIETFITDVINNNVWLVIPVLLIAAGVYFGLRTVIGAAALVLPLVLLGVAVIMYAPRGA